MRSIVLLQFTFYFLIFLKSSICLGAPFIIDPILGDQLQRVQLSDPQSKMTVFWWNVQEGFSHLSADGSTNYLSENLRRLVHGFYAPELIVLGEYGPQVERVLTSHTKKALHENYPFQGFVSYSNSEPHLGFKYFSKHPISDSFVDLLDWVPKEMSKEQKEELRKLWAQRMVQSKNILSQYFRISMEVKGKTYHFVPVHLSHPWRYFSQLGRDRGYFEKYDIFKEIAFGKNNPNYGQLSNLLEAIQKDLLPLSNHEKLILMGDFNIPSDYGVAIGYRLLRKYFTDPYQDIDAPTFPSLNAQGAALGTPVKIDHVFSLRKETVSNPVILPLKGSDHYPLWFQIELN